MTAEIQICIQTKPQSLQLQNSHSIGINPAIFLKMIALSQINRPPLIHRLERIENLTTIIGSPGAPGISTIANQIATQISATVICANHHNLRPITKSKVLNIHAPELNKHLPTLAAGGGG